MFDEMILTHDITPTNAREFFQTYIYVATQHSPEIRPTFTDAELARFIALENERDLIIDNQGDTDDVEETIHELCHTIVNR